MLTYFWLFFSFLFLLFEVGPIWPRLAWNELQSRLSGPSAAVTGTSHHTQVPIASSAILDTLCGTRLQRPDGFFKSRQASREPLRKQPSKGQMRGSVDGRPYPLKAGCCNSPTSHLCTNLSAPQSGTPTPPERSLCTHHGTALTPGTTPTHCLVNRRGTVAGKGGRRGKRRGCFYVGKTVEKE